MRTFVSRMALLLIGSMWILGCGKTSPPASVRPVAGTVSVPAQASTPAATAAPSAHPKPKSKSVEKRSSIPANADPKTVFFVNSIGQPMEIEGVNGALPTDQFEVAMADLRFDSTKFIVELSKASSVSQPLAGSGQPKAGFNLPKGFEAIKDVGYSKEGLPMRIVCVKTGSKLALVPAGTSIVGTDDGPDECKPSFTLRLDAFYMEILEVTVQDYEKYRGEMRERKKPVPPAPSNPSSPAQTPALGIPWGIAVNYARWAGMEIPSEAEYEKAARGPNGLRTPWGDGKALWSSRSLTTTGAYPTDSSPYGIMDLAGNAMEWSADLYSPTSHIEAAASATKDIPHNWVGPKKVRDMNLRVVKGNGKEWSSWHRQGKDMGKGHPEVGFRCVLRIPPDA